jgi:hypothetical protein
VLSFLKDWKVPFKDVAGKKAASSWTWCREEAQKSTTSAKEMTCEDFGWVST